MSPTSDKYTRLLLDNPLNDRVNEQDFASYTRNSGKLIEHQSSKRADEVSRREVMLCACDCPSFLWRSRWDLRPSSIA
jgi:hypothetical protein